MTKLRTAIGSHVLVAALAVGGALGLSQLTPSQAVEAVPAAERALAPATTPGSFADIIEAVRPAVVNIASETARVPGFPGPGFEMPMPRDPSLEEFFRRFFDRQAYRSADQDFSRPRAMGSGFVIDPDGLIVTNHHVVEHGTDVVVTMDDGTQYEADVVGLDAKTDLALLKVEADTPLPFVAFGDSDAARIGDWVIAIGNPFGLGGTATTGIVSARGRDIKAGPFDDFLQIDAPINQGNSGGPLFDLNGKVIGVNTAIYSPNGGNVGIGFAIPASQAGPIVERLRHDGKVARGWLGVTIQPVDADLADGLGLHDPRGAIVASVADESPADRAGLEPGDVVLRFAGTEIEDARDLAMEVARATPNREVELEVWRAGERVTLDVALGESPDAKTASHRGSRALRRGELAPVDALGLSLAPLSDDDRTRYGTDHGALVVEVEPDSPAARRGIQRGDVIVRVGQAEVSGPDTVSDEVARLREDDRGHVVLQIARGDQRQFLAVPLG